MAGGGKTNISYLKQATPKFLQDFKERSGYKDTETTVESKRKVAGKSCEDLDDGEREDEQPTIVIEEGVFLLINICVHSFYLLLVSCCN